VQQKARTDLRGKDTYGLERLTELAFQDRISTGFQDQLEKNNLEQLVVHRKV
jgi:hypothetical protein